MSGIKRVCVYCGSHDGALPEYRQAAERLGQSLVRRGWGLVYGGGNIGLMGRLADEMLAGCAEVIGVIPRSLLERELAHGGATQMIVVESMHERKARMADAADAFVTLPGGIGTMEEMFETWTWLQLGFHRKPIGLLDVAGFYQPLLGFLDDMVARGFLRAAHRECLLTDDDPDRLLDRMSNFVPPNLNRWWPSPERR